LMGVYYTAKFAIPHMKAAGGHIILMGSGLGHRAGDNIHSAYGAAKAGAWMLVRSLAKELKPYRICVNELMPGVVHTGRTPDATRPADSPLHAEWIKTPADVVPLALFIATQPLTGPTGQSFSLMRRDSQ
ncbi:MAG: SDR family oxidoreductase, partial [Chloroflexota bacterium]